MARPNKPGLDYFPLDCQLDSSIEMVEADHGAVGFMVILKLWQRIYGEKGYFCEWTITHQKLFARKNAIGLDELSSIVNSALTHGIFDINLHQKGILTSSGIQKRFANMTMKRRTLDIFTDIILIPIEKFGSKQKDYTTIVTPQLYFTEENGVYSALTPANSAQTTDQFRINTESKQKVNMESKYGKEIERTESFDSFYDSFEDEPIQETKPQKRKKEDKKPYGPESNVLLTDKEYATCVERYGLDNTIRAIEKLAYWLIQKGKHQTSHYGCINTWVWDAIGATKINTGQSEPIIKQEEVCPQCQFPRLNQSECSNCANEDGWYSFAERRFISRNE